MFGRKTRLMKNLADKLGLDYWQFDGGKFLTDYAPSKKSIIGRIELLESGCTCGYDPDHLSYCAKKKNKENEPLMITMAHNQLREDFNLLLKHLGYKIEDGKRIVPIKIAPKPRKKPARKTKK